MALLPAVSASGHSELFRSLVAEADGRYLFPLGNLASTLGSAPSAGVRLGSSYYGNLRTAIDFAYARFETENKDIPVSYLAVGIGLEWTGARKLSPWLAWLPSPGGGLGMYTARVDGKYDPSDRYIYLQGGESEFGLRTDLRWERDLVGNWLLSATGRWEAILTEPRYSRILSAHLGVGWKLR